MVAEPQDPAESRFGFDIFLSGGSEVMVVPKISIAGGCAWEGAECNRTMLRALRSSLF